MGKELEYTKNDVLMRFFDTCEHLKTVWNSPEAMKEVDLFQNGLKMKRVQRELADLLQIPKTKITPDLVDAGFYLCAYEFTIHGLISPWCQLFVRPNAEIVEYASDLKLYYKRGYGHEINSQASCVLFQDLFKRLEKAANEFRPGQPVSEVATVQIGHAETLLPLMTLLGLFKDNIPLTADNYLSQNNRAFRGGKIMPFLGNLMAVLWKCSNDFRLQLRVNEKPVQVPGLNDLSPLFENVKKQYQQILGCNQEAICKNK
ncbi:multiple inositol polyphosphate phosphatase 1-like [Colossoma macropomum]|uniref:multiple inositol polyphosphate phosphatase 1-like n=1 Tax=Colossoma macropomum TaxID=42526 RepID=UPI0018652769|nr:multiple inositol polyphosphate phosphatase 1-like [Colossoma macropomum]